MGILAQGAAHMLPAPENPTTLQQTPTPTPGFLYNLWAIIYTLYWRFLNIAEKVLSVAPKYNNE